MHTLPRGREGVVGCAAEKIERPGGVHEKSADPAFDFAFRARRLIPLLVLIHASRAEYRGKHTQSGIGASALGGREIEFDCEQLTEAHADN